jgi:CRISPR system Cascade subunit CasE
MIKTVIHMMDLFRIAKRPHLYQKEVDSGYLIHCLLKELFQDNNPSPFVIMNDSSRYIQILGYSSKSGEDLKDIAYNNKSKGIFDAIDWSGFCSKSMPSVFSNKSEYKFRLRACPVIRKGRGATDFKPGSEVDVFLSELSKKSEKENVTREEVYKKWIKGMFGRYNIEIISPLKLSQMKLTRFVRKNTKKQVRTLTRPDATFEGKIKINDSLVFTEQLRKGFGRHSAFGVGMILLGR